MIPLNQGSNVVQPSVSPMSPAWMVLLNVPEFLVFPPISSKKGKQPGATRVLTCEESVTKYERKGTKMREKEEAKERRKKEHEEKTLQQETDQKKRPKNQN